MVDFSKLEMLSEWMKMGTISFWDVSTFISRSCFPCVYNNRVIVEIFYYWLEFSVIEVLLMCYFIVVVVILHTINGANSYRFLT